MGTNTVRPGDLLRLRDELLMVVAVTQHKLTKAWEAQCVELWPTFRMGKKFPLGHLNDLGSADLQTLSGCQ